MNFAQVEEIADAVLYEGYMLYPYRPSAVKNQQRWNFGVLCPESHSASQPGSESPCMQTECLLRTTPNSRVTARIRFLQIVQRLIGRQRMPRSEAAHNPTDGLEFVDRLEVDRRIYRPLQEAVERAVTYENFDPTLFDTRAMDFSFPSDELIEELCDARGDLTGAIVRRRMGLAGTIKIGAEQCGENIVKLTVRIENRSEFEAAKADSTASRDAVLLHSLVSTHIIVGVEDGAFVSSLDPPPELRDASAACENIGAWPVLVGDNAEAMLASPIILYDDPKIAPESAGNLFDGTEIDEILSLRILTLTDDEKAEIRQSDERARELLERTESIPNEQFLKLHGVLRGLAPFKEGAQ